MQKFGLGKGLGSLIPKKIQDDVIPKTSPVFEGLKDQIFQIPLEKIFPNPDQPRKQFGHSDLEDLANSIKEHGIIQPLIATKRGDGYQLIAGERRLRAAKILGLKTVPVIVREAKKQEQLELALLENIQRSNLNPIEEAVAYQRLISEFNLSQDELAKRIGKSRPVVTNMLRLLTLPEQIQKALMDNKISYSAARIIVGLPEYDQMKFFTKVLKNELNVREAESEAKRISVRKRSRNIKDANIVSLEEKLQSALGTRVFIKKRGQSGQIIIYFYSDDELSEILKKMKLIS